MPPKVSKGSPRPKRADYPKGASGDAAFIKDTELWNKLNIGTPTPSSPTVTQQGVVETKPVETTTRTQSGKVRTDWNIFTDGSLNIQEGDAEVGQTPYVTARLPEYGEKTPTPVVVLPSIDGNGFTIVPREELLQSIIKDIQRNPGNVTYWKSQLKDYYKSDDAFQRSLRGGPVTDKDTEFVFALRRALGEISANNFSAGAENVNRNQLNSSGFYDINSWLTSRTPLPGRQSTSTSTRNFTLKADAIADFMREVQIQVGDPKLVDNVKELAEAYWEKVRSEEMKRMGQSTSTYDPITGKTVSTSTGFQMPSEQLLKEWRISFITKGAMDKDKVISTGIRNVKPIDLQDAGGDIGDNYTKLKGYAYEYGVRISDEDLKMKAAEASLPGGSIDEQKRTIQLASRATYKALAPYIEGGLKVKDIGSQFMKWKADELELAEGAIDLFDTDVQAALSGDKLPGVNDYIMAIRSNPAWRFTKKANESAAGFLDTLLKMWGKVG
jgi:hypothetical protein